MMLRSYLMKRSCPACKEPSIATGDVLLSDTHCGNCGALVGFHWTVSFAFAAIIIPVTAVSTLMILVQMDVYAALLWMPFPIGAISYFKARFCRLVAKIEHPEHGRTSDA